MIKGLLGSKKWLICLLVLALGSGVSSVVFGQSVLLGDANGDGSVNIIDALLVAQYAAGLNPVVFNPDAANVDCSTYIDIVDALVIAKYSAGKVAVLACTYTPSPTPTPVCTPCTARVEGYVRDSITLAPLAGVKVMFKVPDYGGSYGTYTDANGYYWMSASGCDAQMASLEANKFGYLPFVFDDTLGCGDHIMNINLVPDPNAPYCPPCEMVISGTVSNDRGTLLSGATITAIISNPIDGPSTLTTTTDSTGRYLLTVQGHEADGVNCPFINYRLETSYGPYRYESSNGMFSCGNQTINFVLAPYPSPAP